jgi:hypothetical protein
MSAAAIISLAVSGGAFFVSAIALRMSRQHDRRDVFLKLHERLIDADLKAGRSSLKESVDSIEDAALLRADRSAYENANRALAMFDILAGYVRRGYIRKTLVLEEWGHTYAETYLHGRFLVAERYTREEVQRRGGWSTWPNLQWFGEISVRWAAENPRRLTPAIEQILVSDVAHDPRRDAHDDSPSGDVPGDDSPGGHERLRPDLDARS